MNTIDCEILIIGAGIAGLTCAIKLADRGKDVVVINRSEDPEESNTKYAQGGIVWWGEDDSTELIKTDIEEAGDEVGRESAIKIIAEDGPVLVKSFLIDRLGINFDKDPFGKLHKTLEGGHSKNRIIHVADQTGLAIQKALLKEAKRHPNIKILSSTTAIDLISTTHHSKNRDAIYQATKILGAYVLERNSNRIQKILSSYTVIASGGIGAVYEYTTNPEGARGDGIAMAKRAGAHVINMEYIQFHPTAFKKDNCKSFLISESVRGEGAILLNDKLERFVESELLPRDELTRLIYKEMKKSFSKNVWLSCKPIIKRGIKLEERFPKIFSDCLECGIDIRKDLIPVAPAAHYLCGGIRVDEWGKTNLTRLYAIGEASCTGLHGANRLASTSLLEGLVWGVRSAENIIGNFSKEDIESFQISDWDERFVLQEPDKNLIKDYLSRIKVIMWERVGIVRSEKELLKAIRELTELSIDIIEMYRTSKLSDELIGLRNTIEIAIEIASCARRNRVSKGSHYREDYL
ncbi:L-aspartate oxidase [Thermodesulfobium acidiphilum]|uniref:L-aspartate oxidase n=1 Tax=Thermodesulfobium acidiphilum TaxID=1794699 RepID=A0A2R4W2T5_THEAF|nr:L-aspartate oxidase [Thermodesulfobium acidiphilum]AWB11016.1 L-aspartate oxidase [Thermodesulfobium acidiphilum]